MHHIVSNILTDILIFLSYKLYSFRKKIEYREKKSIFTMSLFNCFNFFFSDIKSFNLFYKKHRYKYYRQISCFFIKIKKKLTNYFIFFYILSWKQFEKGQLSRVQSWAVPFSCTYRSSAPMNPLSAAWRPEISPATTVLLVFLYSALSPIQVVIQEFFQ